MNFEVFFPRIARSNHKNATKAKILVYILLFAIVIMTIDLIVAYFSIITSNFPFLNIIVVSICLLIIFRITNSLTVATNLFLACLSYCLMYSSLQSGGIYSIDNFFLYIVPVAAYILSEVRSAVFWLVVVNTWFFYLFFQMGSAEEIEFFRSQTLSLNPPYYLFACILNTIISFAFLSIFYNENYKLIKKLETNEHTLKTKNVAFAKQAKQLITTQNQLKASNQELEQYAYVTSHDLKQPIRTINGFANLLKKDLKNKAVLDEENNQFLNLIINSSENMDQLVNDLLSYAKLTAIKQVPFEKLALDKVLNAVLNNLQNQIITNEVSIEKSELPTLEVIPVKINQVFQNIISNAIKFKKQTVPLVIKIYSQKKGNHWDITIEDNGIGIDPQHQQKIFAPFQKLHNEKEYAGSGIGLATCQRIIELHDGKIWVESEKDKGTKFIFTLPQSQQN